MGLPIWGSASCRHHLNPGNCVRAPRESVGTGVLGCCVGWGEEGEAAASEEEENLVEGGSWRSMAENGSKRRVCC